MTVSVQHRSRLRRLSLLLAALLLPALWIGTTAAAHATDPVDLGSGRVLDQVGALSKSELDAAEARLEQLYDDTGVDLFAVFVDDFTSPSSSQEWADAVAERAGLGKSQYLLAVAMDSRQFYTSADQSGPLTDSQIDGIEAEVRPMLGSGDYAGAIDTATAGVEQALGGVPAGGGLGWIFALLVLAAIALLIWLVVRRRRAARENAPVGPDQPSLEELAKAAATALVSTDDAVKTSGEELQYASAQFGDEATAEFSAALDRAKGCLDRAFALKQQLDDSIPDTLAQQREWQQQISSLCAEANQVLDEKAADFDELRGLVQRAPEALVQVRQRRSGLEARLAEASARLEALKSSYASEALATIADNLAHAADRLAFADAQIAAADDALAAGDLNQAAVGIRAAEEAVAQAATLAQAIETLGADLAAAETSAAALIADMEQDLVTAGGLPDSDGRLGTAAQSTRQQLDAARAQLTGSQRSPIAALGALDAANTLIDETIASVRDEQAQIERSRQMLAQHLLQAQAQVTAAEDFIVARRGAVGAEARTRQAEAAAALAEAREAQAADPNRALQLAQRSEQLARESIRHAQQDVAAYSSYSSSSRHSGSGTLGAVLGGILIDSILSGGGPSRGGGGLGGGTRSGSWSPGSFGGGGTRGRRGGGRF